jgi:hypothetical protein
VEDISGKTLINSLSSWPDLFRPSTSFFPVAAENVDARDKPGHDDPEKKKSPGAKAGALICPPDFNNQSR